MSIDWFTVAAQIVNFLVLVWLLKKYLYKPVLDAVRKREEKIAGELADAAAAAAAAAGKKKEYEEKSLTLEQGASDFLDKAKVEAGVEKERLLAEARTAVETQRAGWMEALLQEQEHGRRELVDKTQSAVFEVVRKCLQDLADIALQDRMTAAFLRRIDGLDGKQKDALALAMKTSPIVAVKSAFALPGESQAAVVKMITAIRGTGAQDITFAVEPDLLCGIGLYLSGYKLEWTIGGYLDKITADATAIGRQEISRSVTAPGTATKTR